MKRIFALLASLVLSAALPLCALAQGQTVTIATTFAGYDAAAQAYADALEAWEATSGNTVDDYSGMPDDAWIESVDALREQGTLDILYASPVVEDMSQFVPVTELLEADATLPVRAFDTLTAGDGQLYLMPVRFSFEALYVNTDVFLEHGVTVPSDWDSLLEAAVQLKNAGVIPIANALSDWSFPLFDCAVLGAGTSAQYQETEAIPESYQAGLERIRTLHENGAFGDQALTWTDLDAETAFINHEAAMRFDGEWLCESIPEAQWNNTVVVSLSGMTENAVIGGTNAGFCLTRAAFDDPIRRQAALSLLKTLISEPTASSLFLSCGGSLKESICALFDGDIELCPPLMDVIDFDAYDSLMTQLGGMADGSADIETTIRTAFGA